MAYIESADVFIAKDVKELFNDDVLNPGTYKDQTITIRLPKAAQINETFWPQLHKHRAIRIDGLTYRGSPLGHNYNPLSSTICKMEPSLFEEIITTLLQEHGYIITESLNSIPLFNSKDDTGDVATLSCGIIQKYEIVLQLTNQFLLHSNDNLSLREGESDSVRGSCAVLIHSKVVSQPALEAIKQLAELLESKNIKRLLVFINHYMYGGFEEQAFPCRGVYSEALKHTNIKCNPQHLEDIGYNISIATNIWLKYRDRIMQQQDIAQQKIRTGEWKRV